MCGDVVVDVTHGLELCQLLVRDGHTACILQRHVQLHGIQAVGLQILGQAGLHGHPVSYTHLAHFTRLGAAGVQLATRFITTYECDASQGYKDVLLNAGSEDVRIIHSPVGMPGRALNTPLVQAMAEGRRFPPRHCARCLKTCDPAKVPYCITHALIEAVKGNLEEGLFFCGANVGRLDRMYTVRELMDELVTEWRQNQ